MTNYPTGGIVAQVSYRFHLKPFHSVSTYSLCHAFERSAVNRDNRRLTALRIDSAPIRENDSQKWDCDAEGGELQFQDDGSLSIRSADGRQRLLLSKLAISQVCDQFWIPERYYQRLPGVMKAALANYELSRVSDTRFLIRGQGNRVRAFCNASRKPYRDIEIVELVRPLLERTSVSVASVQTGDMDMFLKLSSSETEAGFTAGVMIENSEVYPNHLSFEPLLRRLNSSGDLVLRREFSLCRGRSRLSVAELLHARATIAITEALNDAKHALRKWHKAQTRRLKDPLTVIRETSSRHHLPKQFEGEVIASFLARPEPTLFGVMNAFTNAAQKLAPQGQIEVERLTGTLIKV